MVEGVTRREAWMPPASVFNYVMDLIEQYKEIGAFPEEIDPYRVPEYWVPLIIVGTLEWICVSGWWPWYYTGVFDTEEAYRWVFTYEGRYELPAEHLFVYRDDPSKNAYNTRINTPGIEDQERSEILQFLLRDIFDRYQKPRPPDWFTEPVIYATLMWVLSEYGRGWLAQDPIFRSVYEKGVAYYSRWDEKVLDSDKVTREQRQNGTCRNCGERLWCVTGFALDGGWFYFCNACIVAASKEGHAVDRSDRRIRMPKCGQDTCLYVSCPHNPKKKEDIRDAMAAYGQQKVEEYRDNYLAGKDTGMLSGRSVEDVVAYFRR